MTWVILMFKINSYKINSYIAVLAMGLAATRLLVIGLLPSSIFASPHLANIERDPFQAVLATSCDSERERLTGWKLHGLSVVVAINRPGYNALMPHGKG